MRIYVITDQNFFYKITMKWLLYSRINFISGVFIYQVSTVMSLKNIMIDDRWPINSLSRDGGRRLAVVPGEERHVQPHLAQRVHREVRLGLQRVCDGEHGHQHA